MPEMTEVYGPGDVIYVKDFAGRMYIYMAQSNGTVILVSEPVVSD